MSSLVISTHEAAGATLGVQVTATLVGTVDGDLVPVTGIVTGTDIVIVRPTTVRITELPFTIDLTANTAITPANTAWQVDVGGDVFIIEKGSGSETLEDCLSVDLPELATPVLQAKVDEAVAAVTAAGAVIGPLADLEIADDAVTANAIAADAVTAQAIAAGAATTAKIADGNVTAPKLVIEDETGLILSVDVSSLPDSNRVASPLVDFQDITGLELLEDRLGVIGGKIGQVLFQGENFPGPPLVSGWRAGAYVDTPLSDGFEVEVVWDGSNASLTAGPLACFDPTDTDHGVGSWVVADPFLSWFELGAVGRQVTDFRYLDNTAHDIAALIAGGDVTCIIRVLHGWAWLVVNGVRVAGPVEVPAGLVGSRRHGVQTDYLDDVAAGCIKSYAIRRYDGPVALDYPPPSLTAGTATKAAGTTLAVPIPNGAEIGDVMVLTVAGPVSVTTPSGWTAFSGGSGSVTGLTLTTYTRTVTGGEAWFGLTGQTLTVTHASGALAGQMMRVADANTFRPLTVGVTADSTSDTTATGAAQLIFGPHRASILAVAAPADLTVTLPSGWTSVANTTGGGEAVTLRVGVVADWSTPPSPLALSASGLPGNPLTTGAQNSTLATASRSVSNHIGVAPDPIGAPA